MEYKITMGELGSETYEVVKVFTSQIWTERYLQVLNYKGKIYDGASFTYFGTKYTIHVN